MSQQETLIQEYLDQLSEKEKITLEIAKEHLETSFNIEKCIGFTEWKKQQDKPS
jgi:hypothetical protein